MRLIAIAPDIWSAGVILCSLATGIYPVLQPSHNLEICLTELCHIFGMPKMTEVATLHSIYDLYCIGATLSTVSDSRLSKKIQRTKGARQKYSTLFQIRSNLDGQGNDVLVKLLYATLEPLSTERPTALSCLQILSVEL
jgi:serine/threonine protein kinase